MSTAEQGLFVVKETRSGAPEVMNIRDVAEYLGVCEETVYRKLLHQELPGFKIGNRWRVKKSLLDAWMEEESARNVRVESSLRSDLDPSTRAKSALAQDAAAEARGLTSGGAGKSPGAEPV